MSLTASRTISQIKLGRAYVPPIAALYLYSLTSNNLYGFLAGVGAIAAVTLHAQNRAIYGPNGENVADIPDEELFPRTLIAIFKKGGIEDYPGTWREVQITDPNFPTPLSRIPVAILWIVSRLSFFIIWIFVVYQLAIRFRSLEFVGLVLLFAMIVLILQQIIWPHFWSVSNERDRKNPDIDAPDYERLEEFKEEINRQDGIWVKDRNYSLGNGGTYHLHASLALIDEENVIAAIEFVSFAFAGLVNATDRPMTKLDGKIETQDGQVWEFSISRTLTDQFVQHQIDKEKYVDKVMGSVTKRVPE